MARLRVVTWNAEGMFVEGTKTRRALPHDAIRVVKELEADILVIPEFGRLSDLRDETTHALESLGYELSTLAYDEPRTPGLGFAILSRLRVLQTNTYPLLSSKRQLLEVVCKDDEGNDLHVFGAHLDDRSEAGRMNEIVTISEIITARSGDLVLLLGDFNAMHRDSLFARLARSKMSHATTRYIRHELVKSMATRVQEMAIGTTIEYLLTHTTLRDLDPRRKRTISGKQSGLEWAPAVKLAKIDWIFGSMAFRARAYKVYGDVGSDHRPVIADLEY